MLPDSESCVELIRRKFPDVSRDWIHACIRMFETDVPYVDEIEVEPVYGDAPAPLPRAVALRIIGELRRFDE